MLLWFTSFYDIIITNEKEPFLNIDAISSDPTCGLLTEWFQFQIWFALIYLMLTTVCGNPYIRQYTETTTESSQVECCDVQKCSRIFLGVDNHSAVKCYVTRVCGRECYQTGNKRVLIPFANSSPSYRRKGYVRLRSCSYNGVCSYREYDCSQICPDPSQVDFEISRLTETCKECYDRIN